MGEPVGKVPRAVQHGLEEVTAMFVGLPCHADRTNMIDPRFKVGLFWLCFARSSQQLIPMRWKWKNHRRRMGSV
jgi:hypothetical protein